MKLAMNLGLCLCLAVLATACRRGPDGLSKDQVAGMIEAKITEDPADVLGGKDGGNWLGGKDLAVVGVNVTSCKLQGSGRDNGRQIWTYIYEAEGNIILREKDSDKGEISGFEVSGRMRFSGEPGAWQLTNINY